MGEQLSPRSPSLFRWTKRSPRADTIRSLYGVIVAQARRPPFYADYGVPDTPAGRFDMILLHLILVVRRLREEPAPIRALGQGVFDLFCRDMDHTRRSETHAPGRRGILRPRRGL